MITDLIWPHFFFLVFYLVAILVLPLCVLSWAVVPNVSIDDAKTKRQIDMLGVGTITAGLVLFVYAISDANTVGKLQNTKVNVSTSIHNPCI